MMEAHYLSFTTPQRPQKKIVRSHEPRHRGLFDWRCWIL